ncbi:hypothetical protein BDP27DRAFT_1287196 [Rhodocollybia butyracea]|uniref:Uncharacterized protein n=1 Tax=Rhodocollybia butyracea TaxID=206335 RepID=A0A9P5Q6H9_9AGAR|nr:hypothetical protein BDP27DRAFT_1287196 [Rhodocollybia butyracea]
MSGVYFLVMTVRREMFNLLREYAYLAPAKAVHLPTHIPFTEINRCLLDLILLNSHFQKYPPSKQYQRSFWKVIIAELENSLSELQDEDEEIDHRVLDHYLSILPSSGPVSGSSKADLLDHICDRGLPKAEAPSKSFVTHFWKHSSDDVFQSEQVNLTEYQMSTLEESRTTIENGQTGLRTWFASHLLARYLIQNRDIVEGKRVLELGSGIGFLGIIASSLQQLASEGGAIWLTDVNNEVLSQCQRNVQLPCNLSSTHQFIHYRSLDWVEALQPDVGPLEALLQDEIDPDIVLGADIVRFTFHCCRYHRFLQVFDPTLVLPLIALITLALQPGCSHKTQKFAIIALTVRNTETFQLFLDCAQEKGLILQNITLTTELDFIDPVEVGASAANIKAFKIILDQNA